MNPDSFCILPWIGTHLSPTGKVFACCVSLDNNVLGDLHTTSLANILNSDSYKKLRRAHLNGERPSQCQSCYKQEIHGQDTMRMYYNRTYESVKNSQLKATKDDGCLENIYLLSIDLRFSNVCNFKCRTCGPEASTSWYVEANTLNKDSEKFNEVLRVTKTKGELALMLEVEFRNLQEIYISGGEPLIEQEHYDFLEQLVFKKMINIRLRYNTNLSTLSSGRKSILDYWNKFTDVTLVVSCDGFGKHAEFIRKGTIWEDVVQNYRIIQHQLQHVKLFFGPTVSIFNVFHLISFMKYLIEEKLIATGDQVLLNILSYPSYYSIALLNNNEKKMVEKLYRDFIVNELPLMKVEKKDSIVLLLDTVLKYMKNTIPLDLQKERRIFAHHTVQLNKSRNENLMLLFPELKCILLEAVTPSIS